MSRSKKYVIAVVGPTASGKTDLSIGIAKMFKTEIVSADSRQFYREIEIGTAKPSKQQLQDVQHHFINSLGISELYDVGRFEVEVMQVIKSLHQEKDVVVVVGGSGLFIQAICEGFDEFPEVPSAIREKFNELYQTEGLRALQDLLKKADLEYYDQVDNENPRRLIRALEICETTGQPFSSFLGKKRAQRDFKSIKVGIEWPRAELYARIDQRVDQMLEMGLEAEARALYKHRNSPALDTVGYKEWFDHFDGKYDQAEAIRLIKRNSRRYAKRQLTWFRKAQDVDWFPPGAYQDVLSSLRAKIGLD